jgi:general secretion pathway protein E
VQAVKDRASDIHIEPFERALRLRYRVDGVLSDATPPPKQMQLALVSRFKIMASLDIAERRLPQDGRMRIRVGGKDYDLRVSIMPTVHGEKIVLRVLDKSNLSASLDKLGLDPDTFQQVKAAVEAPHGLILVTGPTGSGKTTTLYSALNELNNPIYNIITVEDPVEFQIPGINQVPTKKEIGLTFANALRSILRQDPDIIMIGEMRDLETAKIAIQSALTGHLVLSTLHTNNAAGAITRMLDMGVEDYLLTSTVNGVLAQRLVRRLDRDHAERYEALPEVVEEFGLRRFQPDGKIQLYKPMPSALTTTGYHGRTTIMEFLVMSDPLRRMVMQHADMGKIEELARSEGMRTMYEDGLVKALAGVTTIEEVLRVTQET